MGLLDSLVGKKLDREHRGRVKYTIRCTDGREQVLYVKNDPYEMKKYEDIIKENPYWTIVSKEILH